MQANNKVILNKKEEKTIKILIDEIKNNSNYYKLFNHRNQKYKLEELLECVMIVFKLGISYRNIQPYTRILFKTY